MTVPSAIEVVTLFVDDIGEAKAFYLKVFKPLVLHEDNVSCVFKFDGAMVNILQTADAPELVLPMPTASASSGASILLTIRVADVDAVRAQLQGLGVAILNGPIDRPWGRRTAAFADPSGHVWEIAQVLS